jgi:hypothetical protein
LYESVETVMGVTGYRLGPAEEEAGAAESVEEEAEGEAEGEALTFSASTVEDSGASKVA